MKTLFQSTLFVAFSLLSISLCLTSCQTDWYDDVDEMEETANTNNGPGNEFGNGPEVDPGNPDDVSDNSSVNDGNESGRQSSGNPPPTTTNVQHPARIWEHVASVGASPDQYIFLPFEYEVSSHADRISDIFVQITGANTFWRIEKYNTALSGQIILSVKIPSKMTSGEFRVNYRIQDDMGIVSNVLETTVRIVEVANCADLFVEGHDGLTTRSVDLGPNPGRVRITYDMYSVPDRLDVFYGGQWVGGTGPAIPFGQAPPIDVCYTGTPGYIGGSNFFDITYDPNVSRRLDLYVSGCLGGGTAWIVWVECPQ